MKLVRVLATAAALFAISLPNFQSSAETPASNEIASADLAGRPLQQVAITTGDLPAAIGFYRDRLGLPFLFESNGMAFFDMAGTG